MTNTHLLQALISDLFSKQFPLLDFVDHQLEGAIEIFEPSRKKLLRQMNIQARPIDRNKKVTQVYVAEHKFRFRDTTKVSPAKFSQNDLGYSQIKCAEEEHSRVEEYFDTVFYVKYLDKIIGYFSISIEYSYLENIACLHLNLKEIFIGFLHRDREHWLDLTAAVVDFLNGLISTMYQQINCPMAFEVNVESSLSKNSGNRISHAVIKNLSKNLNSLQRKNHNAFVTACEVYSHFQIDDAYEMNVF